MCSRAKKARERDARRAEEEHKEAALASKRSNAPERRKFGTGEASGDAKPRGSAPASGGAGNELAAAMARRRAAVAGNT